MATTISRTKKSRARWTPNRRTTSWQSAAASRPTSRARPRAAAAETNADDTMSVANVSASPSSSSNGSTSRAVVASTVNANAARPPRVSARLTRGFSPPPSMVGARPSNLSRFEPEQARTNSPQFGPFYVGWEDGQGDLSLSNSWCCSAVKLAHARITASRRGIASKASFHHYSSSSASSSTLSDRDEPFSSRSNSPFSSSTSISSSCTCSDNACVCTSDDYYSSIPEFSGTPRVASSSTSSTWIENSTSQSHIVIPLRPSMPLLERTERIWDGHELPSHVLLPPIGTFELNSNSPDETELKLVKFEIEEGSQSLLEVAASGESIAPATMSHWLNEDAWE